MEPSTEIEQIIAGNYAMLMESKLWTIYWFSQGQKKDHLNRMREIKFRETSADTERIKYNTNGIKTTSLKNIDLSKVKIRHSWIQWRNKIKLLLQMHDTENYCKQTQETKPDISKYWQYVYYNCLLTKLWRHKIWN